MKKFKIKIHFIIIFNYFYELEETISYYNNSFKIIHQFLVQKIFFKMDIFMIKFMKVIIMSLLYFGIVNVVE